MFFGLEPIPFKYGYWRLITFFERKYGLVGRGASNLIILLLNIIPFIVFGIYGGIWVIIFFTWVTLSQWGDIDGVPTNSDKPMEKEQ